MLNELFSGEMLSQPPFGDCWRLLSINNVTDFCPWVQLCIAHGGFDFMLLTSQLHHHHFASNNMR